jgi:hypothetical protein
MLRNRSWVAQ